MNLKSVATYATGTVLGAVLSLITLPIIAWLFSQDDVGRVAMFQVVLSLLVVVLSLGLDQAYVRDFNEKGGGESLAKTCLLPGLFLLMTIVLLTSSFGNKVSSLLFDIDSYSLFILFSCTLFFLYLERFLSVLVRMKELSFAYSLTRVIPKIFILGMVSLAYYFPGKTGFVYLVIAQSLGWAISVAIMIFYLRPNLATYIDSSIHQEKIGLLLSFGLPLVINGTAFWGLSFLDRIMIKEYSSLSELGLYALATSLAGVAILFQQIFSTLWHPLIYKWVVEGVDINKIIQVSEGLQIFSFVLVCVIALLSWCIPYFLPKEYNAIQFILVACMLSPLFIMVAEATGVGINVSKMTKYAPLVTLFSLFVNAGLNLWLIPAHGAAGAAASSAVSFYVYVLLRTEASVMLWKKMPRIKFYCCGLIVTSLASMQALSDGFAKQSLVILWLVSLIICLVAYRSTLAALALYMRNS